ncbi:helix-turn-helix domain-containing protein [Flavobacterium foetidum]|uniref:helix-turn-helix domain-containing protein n=1 Tax=Flavobacterium foetidum TaxID=2026681 RepID=UPI0010758076|nr:AraC family transcriptional regulator [Flavobacterium foetidum]KAF2515582.1 helix-turn-helix transcriptional regulator [Flavobacterium foetidum]
MKRITHFYSLTPEWQHSFAKEMGGELIDNKIIVIPEDIGHGYSYFTQVTPGISVLYVDFVLDTPIKITRQKSDNELYIFHFDMSEHVNLIRINKIDYRIGTHEDLGLAIIDNKMKSTFKPAVGDRTLAVRLLVDKKLLDEFIKTHPSEEHGNRKISVPKKSLYYYDHIDSHSMLLIRSIKDRSVFDSSFESYLKGISLRLLGNFLDRYEHSQAVKDEITDVEIESVTKTQTYLLDNLYNPFPSVPFLSKMAGMSPSKYKMIFKKQFHNTPKNLFIEEKMILANRLLQSGDYKTLTEVIYELNYSKLSYFCSKYYELFHRKPADDLVKKKYNQKCITKSTLQ